MIMTALGASNIRDALIRFLCGIAAGFLAVRVYIELLSRFTMARFWEGWVKQFNEGFTAWAPIVAFASLTGIVGGIALGAIFRTGSIRVAAVAALVNLVVGFTAGGTAIVSGASLAVGLLVGAAVVTRLRRA